MPKKPWTESECWSFVRALEIYDYQYSLIARFEDFQRTYHSLCTKARMIKLKAFVPTKGCKRIPLRAEMDREGVKTLLVDYVRTHPNSNLNVPEYFLDEAGMTPERHSIVKMLQKGPVNILNLADVLDVSPRTVREHVAWLQRQNYLVEEEASRLQFAQPDPSPKAELHSVPVEKLLAGGWYKFGVVSDAHCGSRWTRFDVIKTLYDIYDSEGITEVFLPGNIAEGEMKKTRQDVKIWGFESQIKYVVENWPEKKGILTKYITADDHEGWYIQREGVDFGKRLEQSAQDSGRSDLIYLGHVEQDVELVSERGSKVMRLFHPGGGTSYAISYAPQKIVESYQGGEKPHILIIGHYHKQGSFYIRGVHVVLAGCTSDQSLFMRKHKADAHLGGWIIKFQLGEAGEISRFATEWYPFYDRGFYANKYFIQGSG